MKIDIVIWDFDGVLVNSNEIRTQSFIKALNFLPPKDLSDFIIYHLKNGGLSRYHKLDWLETRLNIQLNKKEILEIYSKQCKSEIVKQRPIIERNIEIINCNPRIHHYIASGSDQNELRYICNELKIDKFFSGIFGSPKPKSEIVQDILFNNHNRNIVLVGDSNNDLEAALENDVYFIPFNFDSKLKKYNKLKSFKWFLKNL